jgi:hypothetical protein
MRTLKTSDWFHPYGFPLSIARKEPQERFTMHTHEFSEIVIILGGRALRLINVLFRPENLHLEPMDLSGLTGYQKGA